MYPNRGILVETDWLEAHLDDPNLRLFDVTGMLTSKLANLARTESYDKGHIPGAAFLDVAGRDGALAAPGAALPWTWPDADAAAETLGAAGIGPDSRVVLYAASPRPGVDKGVMWATRAWWLMHGFGVDCAVLNGGFEKWVAEARPVASAAGAYPPTRFAVAGDGRGGVATKADVAAALDDAGVRIVDALSPDSFSGARKAAYGSGHIPGAVNLPMADLLDRNGAFLPAAALRERLEAAGLRPGGRTICYCGGGIAATADAFAMTLLGHENVAVYDGSLAEWTADPDAPLVGGAAA